MTVQPLLAVEKLSVAFESDRSGIVRAVRNLSFTIGRGETLAIVGESGSGKSVTALSLMRLVEREGGRITAGTILYRDQNGAERDLRRLPEPAMRALRGSALSMIFQEPMTSLNPVLTIGRQLAEVLIEHEGMAEAEALARAGRMLESVRIPDASRRLRQHPHELSGGMRQRVMIAMALLCRPALLIADEPTTALDVTVQAQILALIKALQRESGAAVLLITHDMGIVAEMADRVVVMRQGEGVETGPVERIFAAPAHPYTRHLLAALPRLGGGRIRGVTPFSLAEGAEPPTAGGSGEPTTEESRTHARRDLARNPSRADAKEASPAIVLEVENLIKRFPVQKGPLRRTIGFVHAVESVSFTLRRGETLGLVGESGCGKSTTGRAVLKLLEPTAGTIRLDGVDVTGYSSSRMRPLRRKAQMIFQDPFASLNPRLPVIDLVTEPLAIHGGLSRRERRERAEALMTRVRLDPGMLDRYPHQFSGGQRQRLCIARALSVRPALIVADEPVSALDVSVQRQVLDLLQELQDELGLAYLFISHDMAVVERISDRIAVMYGGEIVETGPAEQVLRAPLHPYTRRLLASVPVPDPARRRVPDALDVSEIPSPIRPVGHVRPPSELREAARGHFVRQRS